MRIESGMGEKFKIGDRVKLSEHIEFKGGLIPKGVRGLIAEEILCSDLYSPVIYIVKLDRELEYIEFESGKSVYIRKLQLSGHQIESLNNYKSLPDLYREGNNRRRQEERQQKIEKIKNDIIKKINRL